MKVFRFTQRGGGEEEWNRLARLAHVHYVARASMSAARATGRGGPSGKAKDGMSLGSAPGEKG